MNLQGRTLWQIAAGNGAETHYARQCLDEDVILVGPGKYGPHPGCRAPMMKDGESANRAGIIRRFAEDISPGNLVVLRVGTQDVYGVGEVVGGYAWNAKFGEVQGWNLQHVRRVRWLWKAGTAPKTFPVYSLKLGSSVQYLNSPVVIEWLKGLEITAEAYKRELTNL